MESDAELLRQYARNRNEAAFTELVSRHLNLVYAVACRETNGDIATAQDITQLVFIDLARKARRLTGHTALAGWLFTSVRLVSANLRRAQQRRAARELNSQLMNETTDPAPPEPQGELLDGPLGDALHELGERDRGAVVLRFLEGHNLRDVGAALGLSEDAARMRVDRASEKLRKFYARRGIVSTASSITAALGAGAMPAQSTIASTASAIAGTALKGAAATSTAPSLLELFLGWMNLKAAAVAVTLLLAGGTTTALLQRSHATRTIPIQPALDESIWTTDALSNLPPLVIIRPTKFTTGAGISRGTRIRWRADTMKHLVAFAHSFDPHQVVLLTPDRKSTRLNSSHRT